MTNYIFQTTATMKPYNKEKWWVDYDIVGDVAITADSLKQALKEYREIVIDDKDGRPKQVGYVLTGKTYFEDSEHGGFSARYINLWVRIVTIDDTVFPEAVLGS